MNVADLRPYLSNTTYPHLADCFRALAEKQHFAAAVWGAVFLEAFLTDLAAELHMPSPSRDDLKGQIDLLRNVRKHGSVGKPEVPEEIVNRCDEIRTIRNRLVHDMGLRKQFVVQDAASIAAHLKVILDWYLQIRPPLARPLSQSQASTGPGVRLFISTTSPHNDRQRYFQEMLLGRLAMLDIEPVRCRLTDFDRKDPIGKVRGLVATCRGLLVVGLERSHAYFLREKEGSDPPLPDVTHRKHTSSWLHLEAGIASALGLDVFVLCEAGIWRDGIFDREWNSYPVTELPSLDEHSPVLEEFLAHLAEWAHRFASSAALGSQPQS